MQSIQQILMQINFFDKQQTASYINIHSEPPRMPGLRFSPFTRKYSPLNKIPTCYFTFYGPHIDNNVIAPAWLKLISRVENSFTISDTSNIYNEIR